MMEVRQKGSIHDRHVNRFGLNTLKSAETFQGFTVICYRRANTEGFCQQY